MIKEIALASGATGLAVGAYFYAAFWPPSQIFGRTLVAGDDAREFALTFDDGPNDPYTGQLLDVLARHDVHATFFMIGRFVRQRPDLVRAVRSAGHLVGNHTMTHPVLTFCSRRQVREELTACNAALEDALGEPVRYFRPPHGARRPDVLRMARRLGLTPVLWNAIGYDWQEGRTAAGVEAHLLRGIASARRRGRGSNLLLHDGGQAAIGEDRAHTVAAVDSLLTRFKSEGVRFVTVDAWNTHAR